MIFDPQTHKTNYDDMVNQFVKNQGRYLDYNLILTKLINSTCFAIPVRINNNFDAKGTYIYYLVQNRNVNFFSLKV